MGSTQDRPAPGRRDPEGRRRAIIDAAAELIVEGGASSLTHRAVAARAGVSLGSTTQYFSSLDELRELALQSLSDLIDAGLAEVEAQLLPLDDAPERLAQEMHAFLSDERAVRADLELVHSGLGDDPRLRELALRWTDRLVEILARRLDPYVAEAIGLYLDGATLHAGLHDEPVSAEAMAAVFRRLMAAPAQPTARATTDPTTTEGSDPR